jgi:hypothetical protein
MDAFTKPVAASLPHAHRGYAQTRHWGSRPCGADNWTNLVLYSVEVPVVSDSRAWSSNAATYGAIKWHGCMRLPRRAICRNDLYRQDFDLSEAGATDVEIVKRHCTFSSFR